VSLEDTSINIKLKDGLELGLKYNSIKERFSTCGTRAKHK